MLVDLRVGEQRQHNGARLLRYRRGFHSSIWLLVRRTSNTLAHGPAKTRDKKGLSTLFP